MQQEAFSVHLSHVEISEVNADERIEAVLRSSGDRLQRFAYQLARDAVLAEEIVQDALVSAYTRWKSHPSDAVTHPYAYVRRCVLNEYLTRRRRARLWPWPHEDAEPASRVDIANDVARRNDIWSALAQLGSRQRAVLVLRFYEGLPDHEIADLLSCRQSTVRSLAARGLSQLRKSAARGRENGRT